MILIFAESPKGTINKAAFEATTLGKKLGEQLGCACEALVIGESENAEKLGIYGAGKVHHINDAALHHFDSQAYASAISNTAEKLGAHTVILSRTSTGKSLAGRIAVRLNAGLVSGIKNVPNTDGGLKASKDVFSGKALATYAIKGTRSILSVMGNSIPLEETGSPINPESLTVEYTAPVTRVLGVKRVEGQVPLPEAERVVSAGRGMKGPENWGIIEELAEKTWSHHGLLQTSSRRRMEAAS